MNRGRTATAAVADRIRIEDEVWEEAFASRIRSRPTRRSVSKARPASVWFTDPSEEARPFGVDAPRDPLRPAAQSQRPAPRRTSYLLDHGAGFRPDRLAMWAMLLGVALMAVAILSTGL